MQLKISLNPRSGLCIPLSYNHHVQSAIYRKLGEVGASDSLHDGGFGCERKFKGFVFGELRGKYTVKDKKLTFTETISLEVRSPVPSFCDALQRAVELAPQIKLFDTWLDVTGAELTNQHINRDSAVFRAVSPVVAYHTQADGHTVFLSPDDPNFISYLLNNFSRKYTAVAGAEPETVSISPVGSFRRVVTNFKGTWITGWKGLFSINGSSRSLEFLYDSGLGSKNSQGFGLLELVKQ